MSATPALDPSVPETPPPVDEGPAALHDHVAHDHAALEKRARFGTIALAIRMVLLQVAVLVGGVALRRKLDPADFGAFAIVQFALAFLAFFGDAGLGGALIQKEEEPTQRELASVWWLQIGLSLVVVLVVMVGAPLFVSFWPDLRAREGVWVFRALAIDLLFTSIRAVPAVLMERHLQFGRLSALEVILSVAFYGTAVFLAFHGFGVMALAWAVVAQGALGVVGAFALRPWRPSFIYDKAALQPIVRFGATYQLKNVVGFLSSAIAPVYGGRALGQKNLGYLNWAQETAFFPLRIVELVSRVSFPLYSRLQKDPKAFAEHFGRAIRISALGTMLIIGILGGIGPSVVQLIYTTKWMPALPYVYVFAAAISIGFITPLLAPLLDALGRPQTTLRLSILTTILLVVLVPLCTLKWGTFGFALGYGITVVIGNVVAIFIIREIAPTVGVLRRLLVPAVGSAAIVALGRAMSGSRPPTVPGLLLSIVALFAAYCAVIALIDREAVREVVGFVRVARKKD
ncbi:MAG: oligosaccharide flippase family protein [Polyangiales bacterium]